MRTIITLILLAFSLSSFGQVVQDHKLAHALRKIRTDYGVQVQVRPKTTIKFGQNGDVDTSFETVWITGGDETFATTNTIDSLSSSDAGDDQDIVIAGHTISGTDLTYVTQTATLDGQTVVALTTPLARVERLYNDGSTDFAGTVYVYSGGTVTAGVPQTAANIHLTVDQGNQSLKAVLATASDEYFLITKITVGVDKSTTASVNFILETKEAGKVFRTRYPMKAASPGNTVPIIFDPVFIVPPNTDIRISASSSAVNTIVDATIEGYFAR